MFVDELTTRVTDGDACGQDSNRSRGPRDSTHGAPLTRQKPGPAHEEPDSREEKKALCCLLVAFDGVFCHNALDSIFLSFSCFECEPARANE